MGSEVHLEHFVSAIEYEEGPEGRKATGVRVKTADGEQRVACDHVISTAAVRELVRSLSPEPPQVTRDAGEGLRYRDFLVVALILKGENLFPDNWIYIHAPEVKVGRIQNFNNWSQAMVPDEGNTCLGTRVLLLRG